jgi:plastocyanin
MNDDLKITGTPSGQSSGVYNYSITLDNHLEQTSTEPFVSATTSTVVNGSITITSSGTNTSTTGNGNNCTINTSLISAALTDQQSVPAGTSITDIVYDIISDCPQITHLVASNGLPTGVSASIVNNDLKITGTPSGQSSGVYNYSITLDNHLEQTSTEPFVSATTSTVVNGSITITSSVTNTSTSTNTGTTSSNTIDELVLTSSQNTLNQSICAQSSLSPIILQLGGDASSVNVTGLPNGIISTLDVSQNTVTISGTPIGVSSATTYIYNVTSNGSQSKTVSGSITVNPDSNIVLISQLGTASQTMNIGNPIFDIIYQFGGGATSVNVSGLPNGVAATVNQNNQVILSGQPIISNNSATNEVYNFTITTIGNQYGCGEASISGSINIINSGTNSSTTSSNTATVEDYTINVTASNSSNYTLSGNDRSGSVSGSDPSVTINVGDTVNFAVDASGHPFYLKTVQGTGTGNLISGVTNNGSTNATVSWTPNASGTYYYQCSLHNGMNGTITVN